MQLRRLTHEPSRLFRNQLETSAIGTCGIGTRREPSSIDAGRCEDGGLPSQQVRTRLCGATYTLCARRLWFLLQVPEGSQDPLLPSEGSLHTHRFLGHLSRLAPLPSAGKHLLYSFPHFLWSQGHHHLSYRRSLRLSTEGHSEKFHHVTILGAGQTFRQLLQFCIQHVLS